MRTFLEIWLWYVTLGIPIAGAFLAGVLAWRSWGRSRPMALLDYVSAQFLMLLGTTTGWVVLIVPCALRAWESCVARYPEGSTIPTDRWRWHWLNAIWGNPSRDGVSGRYSKIWADATTQVEFMAIPAWWPEWLTPLWDVLRAYRWCALRNSADALKYHFRWRWTTSAPLWTAVWLNGRQLKIGYQFEEGEIVPIFDL